MLALWGCQLSDDNADFAPAWQQETQGYYPLSQVNASNLPKLALLWEFDGFVVRGRTNRGVEATPIVKDGVMYTTGPWSVVYALDAKSGKLLWQYDPKVDGQYARRACCDAVNRGVAVEKGRVYVATLDGYLIALDAKTGNVSWKTDTFTDRSRSYVITGAPRIAGDNVVIGNSGAEMGVRGYASAYNKQTGKLAWRFFVVPGDPAKGPDEHPEVTEARKTWDPQSTWNLGGGGTPWDSIVYDPDTNTVYIGTGNGMPHPIWQRSPAGGDNLFLSSILALNANTGRKKWHYQTTPGDSWDYTATQNLVLADIEVGGRSRKVIMQAPKNGFFYVLDRVSGELLSAEKYTTVTWADRIDLTTGRPVMASQGNFKDKAKLVWPSQAGGHNWPPMSYSPKTKLVYIPVIEAPMIFKMANHPYQPYTGIPGDAVAFPLARGGDAENSLLQGQPKPKFDQVLKAWDPVKRAVVWTSETMPFFSGGVMAMGNGLVIQGSLDGLLTVYDGRNGRVLRRINIGTGIMAAPMTYEVDGDQYIAVAAGLGGSTNGSYPPGSAAQKRVNSARLLVFKLGAGAQPALPPLQAAAPLVPAPIKYRGTASEVADGQQLYLRNCARCHGGPATVGGYPNLWKMAPGTHDAFQLIVREGALSEAGMAAFKDVLSAKDVRHIHAFLAAPPSKAPSSSRGLH